MNLGVGPIRLLVISLWNPALHETVVYLEIMHFGHDSVLSEPVTEASGFGHWPGPG